MSECKCETVKLYDGAWQCMLCRRPFIPEDTCRDNNCAACVFEDITDQKPVRDIDE